MHVSSLRYTEHVVSHCSLGWRWSGLRHHTASSVAASSMTSARTRLMKPVTAPDASCSGCQGPAGCHRCCLWLAAWLPCGFPGPSAQHLPAAVRLPALTARLHGHSAAVRLAALTALLSGHSAALLSCWPGVPVCSSRLACSTGVLAGTLCTARLLESCAAGPTPDRAGRHVDAQGCCCQRQGCQQPWGAAPGSSGWWWKEGEAQVSPTALISVLMMRSRLAVLGLPAHCQLLMTSRPLTALWLMCLLLSHEGLHKTAGALLSSVCLLKQQRACCHCLNKYLRIGCGTGSWVTCCAVKHRASSLCGCAQAGVQRDAAQVGHIEGGCHGLRALLARCKHVQMC